MKSNGLPKSLFQRPVSPSPHPAQPRSARQSRERDGITRAPPCAALTAARSCRTPSSQVQPSCRRKGRTPEYCRVLATVEPETDIEVRLPTAWSERLLHLGGVGLEGVIPNLSANAGELQAGYALTASNGGHRDPTRGADEVSRQPDARRGLRPRRDREDRARGESASSTPTTGVAAKYSYFSGCSGGGRAALNAAAIYGDEYDGVIAGAPPVDMPGVISRWAYAAGLIRRPAAKLASCIRRRAATCDGLDGLGRRDHQ